MSQVRHVRRLMHMNALLNIKCLSTMIMTVRSLTTRVSSLTHWIIFHIVLRVLRRINHSSHHFLRRYVSFQVTQLPSLTSRFNVVTSYTSVSTRSTETSQRTHQVTLARTRSPSRDQATS